MWGIDRYFCAPLGVRYLPSKTCEDPMASTDSALKEGPARGRAPAPAPPALRKDRKDANWARRSAGAAPTEQPHPRCVLLRRTLDGLVDGVAPCGARIKGSWHEDVMV